MQFTATKNLNKTEDKHPDYRLYQKDAAGEMITEEYTKKDGTKGEGWKSYGALWINKGDDGKVKSMAISIDDDTSAKPVAAVAAPTAAEAAVDLDEF